MEVIVKYKYPTVKEILREYFMPLIWVKFKIKTLYYHYLGWRYHLGATSINWKDDSSKASKEDTLNHMIAIMRRVIVLLKNKDSIPMKGVKA